MIKGSVHQEDITVLNVYIRNYLASKYMPSDGTERSNREIHNYSGPCQHFFLSNE